MRAVVCLPTYNERENLEPMVRSLGAQLDHDRDRVLVIDDNSPDGTGALADELARELPWVSVLHRPEKQGLGPAYIAGFRHAIAAEAELVIEIDCDFSHDPADVPRLIASCEAGNDVTLGSRWVEGGGTVNWGAGRKLISRGGSLYARTILGVGIRDLTGGFKCFRREVLEAIDLDAIAARGYGFQIETTYRVVRKGFTVVEIPITFVDRRVGESKMGGSIVVEAMLQVPVLRYKALRGGSCNSLFGEGPPRAYTSSMDEVTDATFAKDVLESDVPVIVEFGAPWCRPCKAIEPALIAIAEDAGERARLVKLDIDSNLGAPSRYGILSVPTVILFVGGEARETLIGPQSKSRYERAFAQYIGE